jgi:hypothetical protein
MILLRASHLLLRGASVLASLALAAWSAMALHIDGALPVWLAIVIGLAMAVTAGILLLRARSLLVAAALAFAAPVAIIAWWLTLEPSNDREWLPDVARTAHFVLEGDRLTVTNMRDFHYRSDEDFDVRWVTRSYDLSKLVGMDIFYSFWGPTLIAHTIASWEFEDGSHLAVSIETRKEVGEAYSAVLGFFRQFELTYVVAQERDVIGVRAAHRGEQVFLYRLAASRERARKLLLDYVHRINALAAKPAWYNALTTNCTTAILHHVRALGISFPSDWRLIANGHLPELQYELGSINNSLPFAELRERSDVTGRAKLTGSPEAFSLHIREGLPQRPPRR